MNSLAIKNVATILNLDVISAKFNVVGISINGNYKQKWDTKFNHY